MSSISPQKMSVVIPTYNRTDDLCRCLECLAPYFAEDRGCSDSFAVEVIVSDDACDKSLEMLLADRFSWCRYFTGPGQGPAANRNSGARHARGDWLVFTDDDCLPRPGWIDAYAKYTGEFDVLEGKTTSNRKRVRLSETAPINEYGGCLWSCNFAIRRSLFVELDGFDEEYLFWKEDQDLQQRILKSGRVIKFLPDACVVHPWKAPRAISKEHMVFAATRMFWEKHEAKPSSEAAYFIRAGVASFVKVTLPGVWRYSGKGVPYAALLNLAWITEGLRVLVRK
ncbi:GalNAc(5)-diNAcBac-PP-undecaprenol beta-1,3-glucosyltransferase [Stieleria neptunia]|uniref:GalNAc(5)-diNAcBac-PP-undecaprenol beta-1,3-glucosyltransferase n=1 Tax=Stieleria neptunia TaxID=2527979 RepID=A0A518HKB3_9BACT|nr:glycosyltransferase family A protein [Stieleria neptunia]QDV41302.1 GalNAc(5)-diNAcBac-PP-undecaprenol beta-1,3-glucosyltransferase [Stieleria neptunia]